MKISANYRPLKIREFGLILYCILGLTFGNYGQPSHSAALPEIGAQIWVEPGMSDALIEQQFSTLSTLGMPVTRLFLVWNWMEKAPGQWDFKLYDACFNAAAKHKVRIVATLMPNQPPTYVGTSGYYKVQDGAAAKTEADLTAQAAYIASVVKHYKDHPALDTWMLMNEPGQLPAPDPLALERFKPWLITKYNNDINALNKSWLTGFSSFDKIEYAAGWAGGGWTWPGAFVDWNVFWRDHLTWYLGWIADQIRQADPKTPLHVNPHALIDIQEKYDLPSWMKFLNSMGSSVHPVWHFDALKRSQYTNGVSLVADYVRGAAATASKPFWITELQGGLNLYTGSNAITPKPSEIERWLWTGVAAGAQRTIFWCLNPRLRGVEAGEWAMVDYQYQPTERLKKASQIAKVIQNQAVVWSIAKPVIPQIYVVQSQPTMMLQMRSKPTEGDNIARTARAHKNAVLGTYLGLNAIGIAPQLVNTDQMDWEAKDNRPKLAILPHATSLSTAEIEQMTAFVGNGHTLVLSGLTGFFDHYEGTRYNTEEADLLAKLMGGKVKEIKPIASKTVLDKQTLRLVLATKADARLSAILGDSVWVHQLGKGKVIVVGGMQPLEHYLTPANQTWPKFLQLVTTEASVAPTIRFSSIQPDVLMRVVEAGDKTVTVLANSASKSVTVNLTGLNGRRPDLLYGSWQNKPATGILTNITLAPEQTLVIEWQPNR